MRLPLIVAVVVALVAGAVLLTRRSASAPDRPRAGIVVVQAGERLPATARADGLVAAASAPAAAKRAFADDRAWATYSEGVLRVQLRQVPMLDVGDNLQISCARARCLVTARLPAGLEGENRAMYWRFIQGPAVRERTAELHLPLGDARLGPDDRFVLAFTKAR